jgi:pimeloyl-ACP methyl ester carboxylesterase
MAGTVLLLHGSGPGTTGAAWASLAEALAPQFRVIAPDLPGFGAAPPAPIEEWASLLAPDEPCAVVGNSAGGALALRLAHARAVTRVVAVGSMGAPMEIPPALDALWGSDDPREVLELIFPGPVSDEAVEARRALMQAQPRYRELFPAPRQRWVDALTVAQLGEIDVPVLLIHGSEDRIVPLEHGLALLRALPDARMHIFGGCGHATPLERTDEFNDLVRNFLR